MEEKKSLLSFFKINNIPEKWFLATNHLNLMFMLASGMIMSPKGFAGKYFKDVLSVYPGWILLFPELVPRKAIELCISEEKRLVPCLVEVDLCTVQGNVKAIHENQTLMDINFPDGIDEKTYALLVPSPLPVHLIRSIIFQSRDDKKRCEEDALEYNNVNLGSIKRNTDARLFARAPESFAMPCSSSLEQMNFSPDLPMAAGALMGMFFQTANKSSLSLEVFKTAFDPQNEQIDFINEPILQWLPLWLKKGDVPDENNISEYIFWNLVNKIASNRSEKKFSTSQDLIIDYLENKKGFLDQKLKAALSRLSEDLKALTVFSELTVSELIKRHRRPFSRSLISMFLRDNCSELLQFRHPDLTDKDFLAAAILFAAREGWLGLPLELRGCTEVNEAISHRMAAMAHRIQDLDIDIGPPPQRPIPLLELFIPGSRDWTAAQKKAALLMASESRWDCINTRISLGKGRYSIELDGRGLHILLPGEVKAVVSEVDKEIFFEKLKDSALPVKLEKKVRSLFK